MKRLLILFITTLLIACGGGEQGMFYGDSIEAGSRITTSPSAEAQKWLTDHDSTLSVSHEAVGGSTSKMLLLGQERLHTQTFAITMAQQPARIVGFRYSGLNEKREGITQEEFRAILLELTRVAEQAGKVVILSTPTPVDPTILSAASVQFVEDTAESVRVVAAYTGAVLCDQNQRAKDYAHLGTLATIDGAHPTDAATVLHGRFQALCVLRAERRLVPLEPEVAQ
jgi:hypothetical protein